MLRLEDVDEFLDCRGALRNTPSPPHDRTSWGYSSTMSFRTTTVSRRRCYARPHARFSRLLPGRALQRVVQPRRRRQARVPLLPPLLQLLDLLRVLLRQVGLLADIVGEV